MSSNDEVRTASQAREPAAPPSASDAPFKHVPVKKPGDPSTMTDEEKRNIKADRLA